ncbi:Rpn family recombination-promoting nuclease/putative transposase [Salinibius halmophilus]|uniref:Rpn family recombination-promoting nuclease/putative transposase n=1 Tax=Salinibius halmophilus TaxID=1853216 RepID=UPI000E669B15|nr:Rpn family recombination-promoting nuclease/putative transposase [Salinibius halmophilus]
MAKPNNPHDAFFKQSMQKPLLARQFMQFYLPKQLVSQLNLQSLRLLNTTYVNKQLRG